MTRIEVLRGVASDIERIVEHMVSFDSPNPHRPIAEIFASIEILGHSPLIGRKVKAGLRELVIGKRPDGYVALYRHAPDIDVVYILALRSQRELNFRPDVSSRA